MARLSLCFLLSVFAMWAFASSAYAELPPLVLSGTNPESPGASLTPRVIGRNEEIQTKSAKLGLLFNDGPVARGLEPANTVKIYSDPDCSGPIAGQGPLSELEAGGIGVTVDPESTTTFYATQTNPTETSTCSQGVAYRQVSGAPGAPSLTAVNPASLANFNLPRLIGTSTDPDATISIFTNPGCTGAAVAIGSAELFEGVGIEVSVPDNSETTFYVKAALAGYSSGCSANSISYREVTPAGSGGGGGGSGGGSGGGGSGGSVAPVSHVTSPSKPPAPQLRTVPGGIGNDTTPTITGSAPGATTVFVYASSSCTGQPVAKGSAAQFESSGLEVAVAPNSSATFSAVAGVTGAQSGCSAPVTYIDDSLAPRTLITMAPAAKTGKRKAIFRFTDSTGDIPGTAFFCKVDGGKWKACSSPFSVRHLKPRRYVIRVRAIDEAGNAESKGATRKFKVIGNR
jgi:hypothetical protein